MTKEQTCFFTGHRLIPAYEYAEVKAALSEAITDLIENKNVKYFIAGGALGFDTLAAKTVINLRKQYDIKLILFLPCHDQAAKWSNKDVGTYQDILMLCDQYRYVSNEYSKECMLKRNREMVNASSYCISYIRRNFGGTAYTVNYAEKNGINIIEL